MKSVGSPSEPVDRRLHEAAVQLESLFLRQIVTTSGVFKGGDSAGFLSVRSGMFADALADAVARSGGIGVAAEVERTLSGRIAPTASPSSHIAPLEGAFAEPSAHSVARGRARRPQLAAIRPNYQRIRETVRPVHG